MTTKTFKQFFENFKGEDLRRSVLTRDPESAEEMLNLEYAENQSLVGRQGSKIVSQPLYVKQLFTYDYIDTNGDPQEELLCIGIDPLRGYCAAGSLYRLKTGTFTVTRVAGGTSWYLTNLPNGTLNEYQFYIIQTAPYFTANIDNGMGTSDQTLAGLAALINATANFTCSITKTAIVNGNQTGVTTVTVDSGHTIAVGDLIPVYNRRTLASVMWLEVIATAATTITFKAPAGSITSIDVLDNDVIGVGRFPAAILNMSSQSNSTDNPKTVSFTYWEKVPCSLDLYDLALSPFYTLGSTPGSLTMLPISFVSLRGVCYFTASYALSSNQIVAGGEKATSGSFSLTGSDVELLSFRSGVWKYDGVKCYLSGLPAPTFGYEVHTGVNFVPDIHMVESASGALTSGTYKYRHSFLYVDGKGNIAEFFNPLIQSVTTVGGKAVSITYAHITAAIVGYYANYYDAAYASSTANVAAPASTFTVTAGHTLRTGHTIWFHDFSSVMTRRKITAWTNTSITVDIPATCSTGTIFSTILHRLWRTTAGGSSFFLSREDVNRPASVSHAQDDATADASLGISIEAVEPDYTQASLPPGNALTTTQSILVVGGGSRIPQQVHWEDADSPEFTAPSIFNDRLTTVSPGDISAIATDKSSSLSLFKSTAQFRLLGALPTAQYEIDKVVDTGPGVSGPQGWTQLEGSLVGVYTRGFILTADGTYNKKFGKEYFPLFFTENFSPEHAQVFHDYLRKRVLVFVPVFANNSSASPTGYAHTSDSELFVYDYSQSEIGNVRAGSIWYRFEYDKRLMPSGGFAYYGGKLYSASWLYDEVVGQWTGYTTRRCEDEVSGIPAYDYYDNTNSYDWSLKPQWDDGGLPKVDKAWMEFTLYMAQTLNYVAAFDVDLITYRDWDTSKTDTSRTLSFDSAVIAEENIQFDQGYKARRKQLHLSGTIDGNPPVISGYEYTVDYELYEDSEKFER